MWLLLITCISLGKQKMIAEHMPCVLMIALKVPPPPWNGIYWFSELFLHYISVSQHKEKHHNLYLTACMQLKNNLDQALLGSAKLDEGFQQDPRLLFWNGVAAVGYCGAELQRSLGHTVLPVSAGCRPSPVAQALSCIYLLCCLTSWFEKELPGLSEWLWEMVSKIYFSSFACVIHFL